MSWRHPLVFSPSYPIFPAASEVPAFYHRLEQLVGPYTAAFPSPASAPSGLAAGNLLQGTGRQWGAKFETPGGGLGMADLSFRRTVLPLGGVPSAAARRPRAPGGKGPAGAQPVVFPSVVWNCACPDILTGPLSALGPVSLAPDFEHPVPQTPDSAGSRSRPGTHGADAVGRMTPASVPARKRSRVLPPDVRAGPSRPSSAPDPGPRPRLTPPEV